MGYIENKIDVRAIWIVKGEMKKTYRKRNEIERKTNGDPKL
jgi:hypothetical protein